MRQQCPKCGNWVEGKPVKSFGRKLTRGVVKKGSSMVTGAAIGSFFPGVGTIIGGGLGLIAGTLMEDDVNEVANDTEEFLFGENNEYNLQCPNCGYSWTATGDATESNQAAKEQYQFEQLWVNFFEEIDNITSSKETIDEFLSQGDKIKFVSPVPNSELNFMFAFCAYCASNIDRTYLSISQKFINRAIRSYNDDEYRLFSTLVQSKTYGNTGENVAYCIKMLNSISENNLLLKKEWYMNEIKVAYNNEVTKFKQQELNEKIKNFIRWSIFFIPILSLLIYGIQSCEPDVEWYGSSLFGNAYPFKYFIYWVLTIIFGFVYIVKAIVFYSIISRTNKDWEELYKNQYTI